MTLQSDDMKSNDGDDDDYDLNRSLGISDYTILAEGDYAVMSATSSRHM